MSDDAYERETNDLIQASLAQLKTLSFAEVAALPETAGEETQVAGCKCALTTFVQRLPSGDLLATVQLARRGFVGLVSYHTERGLVFSPIGVREATAEELMESGG